MEVIPGINENNFEEIKRRVDTLKKIGAGFAQIDVSDGKFGKPASFDRGGDLKEICQGMNFEVDLMVFDPEEKISLWTQAGKFVKRIIFHLETVRDIDFLKEKCEKKGIEPAISILYSSGEELLLPLIKKFNFFQILAVEPGGSGQKFNEEALSKIKFLRERRADAKIEVDGGINEETAVMVKEAGADVIVSTSFIFNNPDMEGAYKKLLNI